MTSKYKLTEGFMEGFINSECTYVKRKKNKYIMFGNLGIKLDYENDKATYLTVQFLDEKTGKVIAELGPLNITGNPDTVFFEGLTVSTGLKIEV